MEKFNDTVSWYQAKIGAYDKQLWEKSVEQTVLKGLHNVRKKAAKAKTELIDVDLVRGSTFTKAKPVSAWTAVTRRGIVRVLFFPLFFQWWRKQTSPKFFFYLLVLYILQLFCLALYVLDYPTGITEKVSIGEVICPIMVMFILGTLHSQIVATHLSHLPRSSCAKKASKRKKKASSSTSERDNISTTAKLCKPVDSCPTVHIPQPSITKQSSATLDPLNTSKCHIAPENINRSEVFEHSGNTDSDNAQIKDNSSAKTDNVENASRILKFPNIRREREKETSNSDDFEILKSNDCNEPKVQSRHNTEDESSTFGNNVPIETNGDRQINNKSNLSVHNESVMKTQVHHPVKEDSSDRDQRLSDNTESEKETLDEDDHTTLRLKERNNQDKMTPSIRRRRSKGSFSTPKRSDRVSFENIKTTNPGAQVRPGFLNLRAREAKEHIGLSSCESDTEGLTPSTPGFTRNLYKRAENESKSPQTSEGEWEDRMDTDVNTSDTSVSECDSNTNNETSDKENPDEDPFYQTGGSNTLITSSTADRVSCVIWDDRELNKVDLTALDIGWMIIERVDKIPETADYLILGVMFSVAMCLMPSFYRVYFEGGSKLSELTTLDCLTNISLGVLKESWKYHITVFNSFLQRLSLGIIFFFLLSVAERTFKQRLLYAKHFCYLTSSRRAKKYELPHFRLNKVRNIKTWLSLRSYLKKRGPQRSVDLIVSASFLIEVILISLLCIQLLSNSEYFLTSLINLELSLWAMALAIYLLRFMTLGTKINKKYRNFSVLITEQINLYLHMEQKPHKKEELMLANNVLKLAEDLLKELESPFKISGFSASPILYNITKITLLSAFSAILSELLGFKLKLYKIKLKV
ncbi:unnamed protein product [Owenia fusiformis]|uniref:Uncharacterized protein n=1 Tax=Owenia fusiformis TaxID=6347 RepID=A0A8J1UWM7_OWEFU|nr:unnamed protein product [Owenia fusiformis]